MGDDELMLPRVRLFPTRRTYLLYLLSEISLNSFINHQSRIKRIICRQKSL